jgi:hypothetical protein
LDWVVNCGAPLTRVEIVFQIAELQDIFCLFCYQRRRRKGKICCMSIFHSAREAKEFLVPEIVAEAANQNVPLSEVERKMLYFTESGWTLPDIMEISDSFDRDYDQDEYEQKVAKLVVRADRRLRKGPPEEYDKWWAAIGLLQREDHYISVMIRSAALRPRGDQLRLFVTAIGIVSCFLA